MTVPERATKLSIVTPADSAVVVIWSDVLHEWIAIKSRGVLLTRALSKIENLSDVVRDLEEGDLGLFETLPPSTPARGCWVWEGYVWLEPVTSLDGNEAEIGDGVWRELSGGPSDVEWEHQR